jgi:hypothetical protein
LPKKIQWNDFNIFYGTNAIIKKRDKVTVKLGYDDNFETVFKGYVKSIHRKFPVEIECEDEMFRLKWAENTVKKNYFSSVSLDDLLKYCLPADINYVCADMELGQFDIPQDVPVTNVLEHLTKKETYGLFAYFQLVNDEPILYVGLPNIHFIQERKTQKFKFEYNIISDSLQYSEKDDIKIKIKAISIMSDNTKYEIEHGDSDGGLRTFNYYNMPQSELKKKAEELYKEFKVDGYSGCFSTFGEPFVRKADAVMLLDDRYVNQLIESYSINKVSRKYNTSGYRQTINIDRRIS